MAGLSRRGFLLGSAAAVVAAKVPIAAPASSAPVIIESTARGISTYLPLAGEIGEWHGMRFVEQMVSEMKDACGIAPAILGAPPRPRRRDQYVMVIPPYLIETLRKGIAASIPSDRSAWLIERKDHGLDASARKLQCRRSAAI